MTKYHSKIKISRILAHWPYLVVSYAPPQQPRMPPWQPSTQQQPCPSNHTCPLATIHAPLQPHMPPSNHAHPVATMHIPPTMHAPPQPCMPPTPPTPPTTTHAPSYNHTCPPQPHMPPSNHAHSPLWTEWHTRVKIWPCPKLRLRAVKIRRWLYKNN